MNPGTDPTLSTPFPPNVDTPMFPLRRILRHAALALASFSLCSAALAQGFPSRTLTMVVPFPPGGITDQIARVVAQKMQDSLGRTVVVENRPGAGGQIAASAVRQADADGHTLFIGATEMFAINQNLYRKFSYDPLKDFEGVAPLVSSPLILVVPHSSPASSVQDLIALSRTQPKGLTFASQGIGSIGHLLGELFRSKTGGSLHHVAYRGSAPALQDLSGGQVDLMFDPVLTASPLVAGGKLKALAIAAGRPAPALPQVRPLAQLGVAGVDASVWFGMAVKAGTPAAVVRQLNAEVNKALRQPDVVKRFGDQGLETMSMSPEQFNQFLKDEVARWTPLVKASGASVD